MSSESQSHSASPTLRATLLIACLFACACVAIPDDPGDDSNGGRGLGTGGSMIIGVGGATGGASSGGVAGHTISSGGALGFAGSFGTSGSAGTAGFTSGAGGHIGVGGSNSAAGSGSGGAGSAGTGGQGFGGHAHGGSGGTGGTGGSGGSGGTTTATVTFTQLYTQFFNNNQFASNCAGSTCHNPGIQRGIDFSTQAKGYSSVKGSLSSVISAISNGSMPRGRPQWPATDLALLKAWQAEGAPNN